MARASQPDDPDLAAAAAIRKHDEQAHADAVKDHAPVTFVSPDGVERVADSPGEKVALAFAGWTEKKTSASSKKDA